MFKRTEIKRKVCGKLNELEEAGNQSENLTSESNEYKHIYKALNDIIRNYEGSPTCSKKRMK